MPRAKVIALSTAGLLVAASLLTMPAKTNTVGGPLFPGAQVDPEVLAIVRRACQDCHSDTTHYPWYSYVAPVSFLIRSDVNGGREHLNFSRWNEIPVVRRIRRLTDIANQVKDREMPLWQYTLIHRDAKLTDADVNTIFEWTQKERARLIADSAR
jgi:hypothetical protein